MSEPHSFFLRISIKKEQYLDFMKTKPSQPSVNNNWLTWWDSRQMCRKSNLIDNIRAWNEPSNQDIVNGWLTEKETMTFSEFDETANIWEFGIIMCSQNYSEILPLLVFCESIYPYKLFSSNDFAIIYPYFWGDREFFPLVERDVMAYLTFPHEGFVLSLAESVADVDKNHLDYAESRLEEKWKEFEAKMDYD